MCVAQYVMMEENEEFINPIDPEKIAENPGLLPYASSIGSALIKPEDKGKIKGRALSAMEEQIDVQLQQLYGQIETLAKQARELKERKEISYLIYTAEMSFEPIIGKTYHLYRRHNGERLLSLISPEEWGNSLKYTWIATVRMLSDHTWEISASSPEESI